MSNGWILVFVCFICAGTASALAAPPAPAVLRRAARARAVITGMRETGTDYDHLLEVELDLMVSRPEGGQFPAHELALIPAAALCRVEPGCVVEAYYRRADDTVIAVYLPD